MKKPAASLLAVTLAAAPVGADTPPRDPWAPVPHASPQPPPPPAMQASALLDSLFAVFGVERPRVLASGAPACGNVQLKAPRPASCDEPAPPAVITAQAKPERR
jgi:hypothetical protein